MTIFHSRSKNCSRCVSIGREDEATGSSTRDVHHERSQSSGGTSTTSSVGLQSTSSEARSLPLRLLRRFAAQRRTAELTGKPVFTASIHSTSIRLQFDRATPIRRPTSRP